MGIKRIGLAAVLLVPLAGCYGYGHGYGLAAPIGGAAVGAAAGAVGGAIAGRPGAGAAAGAVAGALLGGAHVVPRRRFVRRVYRPRHFRRYRRY
jgi:hypothetical protein